MKILLLIGFLLYLSPAVLLASNQILPPLWYFIGLIILSILISIGLDESFNKVDNKKVGTP